MEQLKIVLSTFPTHESAETFAKTIVEERLAACVNIVPGLTSVYKWDGKLNAESEVLVIIKTSESKIVALELRVKQLHSYQLPEFVVLEVNKVSAAYGAWVL